MYTSQAEIQRKEALANALRGNMGQQMNASAPSGLAYMLNQYLAGKTASDASQATQQNEQLRQEETSRLTEVLGQGGLHGPTQDGGPLMPEFSHPDVQNTALAQALESRQMNQKAALENTNAKGEYGVSPVWFQDESGNYVMGQLNKAGGMETIQAPEGYSAIPDSGRMGYNPESIETKGQAETAAEVSNIQQTSTPQAQAAAEQAQAVGEVENALTAQRTYNQKDIEREFERGAAQKSVDYAVSQMELLAEDAQRLLDHGGLEGAFGWDNIRSKIPGTEAADAKAVLDTLKNKNFITALGAMREASKTGGAVGNVSNAEGGRFENALVALDQAQSDKQIKEELQRLLDIVNDSVTRMKGAFNDQYGSSSLQSSEPIDELPSPEDLMKQADAIIGL